MKAINGKKKWLLLNTVQKQNILPLTSVCNLNCIFCSHKNNPPGVKTYSFGHLSLELIKELIDYLSPYQKVTLGESATRIIEGEPFLHPDFKEILSLIRDKWREKEIKIATNGSFLTKSMVDFLKRMEPISLNVSLNCATPENREYIMKDKNPQQVFKGLEYLNQNSMEFHGSIVALPHITGWDTLKNTIEILNQKSPQTIRVFLPGFTKYTDKELTFSSELLSKLRDYINKLKKEYQVPLILEPPLLKNLQSRIEGISPGAPADKTDLQFFDKFIQINQHEPLTRVEGYYKLFKSENPEIKLKRGKKNFKTILHKSHNEKSGLVFNYDISPERINTLKKLIKQNKSKKILIITSELANDIIGAIMEKILKEIPAIDFKVLSVTNRYFGGSIMCTGLLVTEDIIKRIKKEDLNCYEIAFLPENIYDYYGNDLTGNNYKKIEEQCNLKVKLI